MVRCGKLSYLILLKIHMNYLSEHQRAAEMETNLGGNPKYADKLAEMEELLLEQMIAHNDPYRLEN